MAWSDYMLEGSADCGGRGGGEWLHHRETRMEAGRPQAIVLVQMSSDGSHTWVVAVGRGGEKWSVRVMDIFQRLTFCRAE